MSSLTNNLRNKVRSNADKKISDSDFLIGYLIDEETNSFKKYYIENTPDSISSFITISTEDKFLTDNDDNVLITTMGPFIDLICDIDYLQKELQGVLIEYQTFSKEPTLKMANISLERIFLV